MTTAHTATAVVRRAAGRATKWLAVAIAVCATGAHADVDVSNLIAIEDAFGRATATAGSYDRRTGEARYTASLKNITMSMIVGPLYVTVEGVTAPGVFDKDHDDALSTGQGVYRVEGNLNPQETVKKELIFHNPERYRFDFDVTIWADAASNPHLN